MWPFKAIQVLFSNAVNAIPWLLQNNSDGGRGFTEERTFRVAKSKRLAHSCNFYWIGPSPRFRFSLISDILYMSFFTSLLYSRICIFNPPSMPLPCSSMWIPVRGRTLRALVLFACELKPIYASIPPLPPFHSLTPPPLSSPPASRPFSQSAGGIVNFIFSCRNHFVFLAADEISCNTSSGKINKYKWIPNHPHFLDAPTRERSYTPFFMHPDSECFYCPAVSLFLPPVWLVDVTFFLTKVLLNALFLDEWSTLGVLHEDSWKASHS